MRYTSYFLLLALTLPFSCSEISSDCNSSLICTEQFNLITLSIKDESNSPILLDSAYTIHSQSNQVYQYEYSEWPMEGTYIVLTDSEINEVSKDGSSFIFRGFIGGIEIVNEAYQIGHDCCHIKLLAGNTGITLEN